MKTEHKKPQINKQHMTKPKLNKMKSKIELPQMKKRKKKKKRKLKEVTYISP